MKAIETLYEGVKYRSRTEARWAALFRFCRLAVEYEAEGFDLDGEWYLPDFRVQAPRSFIEIKGEAPTRGEVRKASKLALVARAPVLILSGAPVVSMEFRHVFICPYGDEVTVDRVGLAACDRRLFVIDEGHADIFWFGERQDLPGSPYPSDGLGDAISYATTQRFGVHD